MSGPCTDCGGPDYQTLVARIAAMEAALAEREATLDTIEAFIKRTKKYRNRTARAEEGSGT